MSKHPKTPVAQSATGPQSATADGTPVTFATVPLDSIKRTDNIRGVNQGHVEGIADSVVHVLRHQSDQYPWGLQTPVPLWSEVDPSVPNQRYAMGGGQHRYLAFTFLRALTDEAFQKRYGFKRPTNSPAWTFSEIPALVSLARKSASGSLADQLREAFQSENVNPIDRAKGLAKYMEITKLSGNKTAAEMGINESTLRKMTGMLKLPPGVQSLVACDDISPSDAYELVHDRIDSAMALEWAQKLASGTSSKQAWRDEVRALKRDLDGRPAPAPAAAPGADGATPADPADPAAERAPKTAVAPTPQHEAVRAELATVFGRDVECKMKGEAGGAVFQIAVSSMEDLKAMDLWLAVEGPNYNAKVATKAEVKAAQGEAKAAG